MMIDYIDQPVIVMPDSAVIGDARDELRYLAMKLRGAGVIVIMGGGTSAPPVPYSPIPSNGLIDNPWKPGNRASRRNGKKKRNPNRWR